MFINLGQLPVRLFDESRSAVNAYEMNKNGQCIVTHFRGEPDLWNTKPPLMIWMQVAFMKVNGVNEWSIRLPAAIAAFLTCLLLFYFCWKYLEEYWYGIISMLILVTSYGFMEQHGARTGDSDALMTLFTVLYSLAFFLFIEKREHRYLYLTFIFIALSALTKGIAGLLMLPGLGLYALVRLRVLSILKNRHFYFGVFLALVLVGWYYLLREYMNPGFLEAVVSNELGGRYLQALEQEDKGFWYYFELIRLHHYRQWFIFLLPGFLFGLWTRNKLLRKLVLYAALLVILFFLVISISKTRHEWYPMPMYPFMALLIGAGTWNLMKKVLALKIFSNPVLKGVVLIILMGVIFYEPYRIVSTKSWKSEEYSWEIERYRITNYLRHARDEGRDIQDATLACNGYFANSWFYVFLLNDMGYDIRIVDTFDEASYNGKVIAFQPEVKEYMEENHTFDVLDEYHNVKLYRIDGEE
jgi:4-amino-4-deoxy-L-arabinose transferase-like glycosyltransferase